MSLVATRHPGQMIAGGLLIRRREPYVAPDEDEVVDTAARPCVGMEHRQGIRCRVLAPVRIHRRDVEAASGIVFNISRCGMFVRCAMVPETGACVDIEVTPLRGLNRTIHIPALVVHRRERGFGVIFRRLDTAALEFVEHSLR